MPPKRGDYEYGTDECGPLAWWRECHRGGEDKGSYTPGRGYTSYRSKPLKVCATRCFHGCPSECGLPDEEHDGRVSQRPDPDWDEAWKAIRQMKGASRKRYTETLVKELIESVKKWRTLAGLHGEDAKVLDNRPGGS